MNLSFEASSNSNLQPSIPLRCASALTLWPNGAAAKCLTLIIVPTVMIPFGMLSSMALGDACSTIH